MKYLLLVSLLMLAACQKQGTPVHAPNQDFGVEKLFTVEGCTVYRFYDDRTVYFTNCSGATHYEQSCGKNCTQGVSVEGGK